MGNFDPKIDFNGYYGSWPYWHLRHGSAQQILDVMDRYKIAYAAIGSTRAIFSDWQAGNEEVFALAQNNPNRFIPFMVINPIAGEAHCSKLREYVNRGAKGLRLYPIYHSYNLVTPPGILAEILEECQSQKWLAFLPIRIIMNWGMPVLPLNQIESLLVRFPDLSLVLGGLNYSELRAALPLLQKHKNVYIETSCLQLLGAIERLTELIGAERILFGTALPLQNPGCEVAKIENLEISQEERQRIFRENSKRLLKIPQV